MIQTTHNEARVSYATDAEVELDGTDNIKIAGKRYDLQPTSLRQRETSSMYKIITDRRGKNIGFFESVRKSKVDSSAVLRDREDFQEVIPFTATQCARRTD